MKKVFLGGACSGSNWREEFKPLLTIDYFDPVVDNCVEVAQAEGIHQRENCDCILYCLTPKMHGVYSVAELIDDSHRRPEKTVVCILREDEGEMFDGRQYASILQVAKLAKTNGARIFHGLPDAASYLNRRPLSAASGQATLDGLVASARELLICSDGPMLESYAWMCGRISGALEGLGDMGCEADFSEAEAALADLRRTEDEIRGVNSKP